MPIEEKFPIIDEVAILKSRLEETKEIIATYSGFPTESILSLTLQRSGETNPEREFVLTVNGNDPIFMPQILKDAFINVLKDGFLPSLEASLTADLTAKILEL